MGLSLITFSSGTVIKSAEVNSNFNAINTELFDIDQGNFNVGAQLPDTLLATIATAGKVNGSAVVSQTVDGVKGQYVWYIDGVLAVGTNQSAEFEVAATLTIVGVRLRCKTAPQGANLIVDINKNGTTIFTTRPEIDAGQTTDDNNHVISVTALATGDILTVDIDQVGSTTPGSNLTVIVDVKQKVPQ